MFNCNFFRRARGPSEEPSPPAPDQTSPEAAWESSLLFPGMSGGLTTCIHLLRCMLAASLQISSYFSEIQWFHSACFRYWSFHGWSNDLIFAWTMNGLLVGLPVGTWGCGQYSDEWNMPVCAFASWDLAHFYQKDEKTIRQRRLIVTTRKQKCKYKTAKVDMPYSSLILGKKHVVKHWQQSGHIGSLSKGKLWGPFSGFSWCILSWVSGCRDCRSRWRSGWSSRWDSWRSGPWMYKSASWVSTWTSCLISWWF